MSNEPLMGMCRIKKTCFGCRALVVNYYSCKCFIGYKMKHCVPLEPCYKPTNISALWRHIDRFPKDFLAALPKEKFAEVHDYYRRLDAGEFDIKGGYNINHMIVEVSDDCRPAIIDKLPMTVIKKVSNKVRRKTNGKI